MISTQNEVDAQRDRQLRADQRDPVCALTEAPPKEKSFIKIVKIGRAARARNVQRALSARAKA
jgi:hypothetical protein